ncbi:MAG: replicative DNA helicase [Candidatus Abyssobacteria bacterium SURF_5]|uniref:Replicative DNA helicase n=1 Tax=Abyssobacteria bacterium (strain SURF_5) TaxID=2093360 RepID=A0A3A4NH88_ABYX5|nr:MAG: replicative DNA helicase [Candidatus Abyssubacteria bacterium SURF_5]
MKETAAPPARVPPHNREAEQCVLGAMLFDDRAVGQAVEKLRDLHFYDEAHRRVFRTICELYNNNSPIDLISISEKLRTAGELESVGGGTYLAQLLDMVPTVAHLDYYMQIVREKAWLRELLTATAETMSEAYTEGMEVEIILDRAEKRIFEIVEKRVTSSVAPIGELVHPVFKWVDDLYNNRREVTGIPTGYGDLDRLLSGLQNSDLIIIAGRPSMGKTSFAINIAQHVAIKERKSVAIFSLEMAKPQLVLRMLCSQVRSKELNLRSLQTGYFDAKQYPKLTDAAGYLAQSSIFIDDSPSISAMEIRAKARMLKAKNKLDLIVIDYLQLMEEAGRRPESRQQEIAMISRHLKALARELEVPVIALSQLSRAVERREENRPQLADLRESGAIEQDADVVLMLFREEYYARLQNPNKEISENLLNKAEVIVAKQRNGPTGIIELNFFGDQVRFENRVKQAEPF